MAASIATQSGGANEYSDLRLAGWTSGRNVSSSPMGDESRGLGLAVSVQPMDRPDRAEFSGAANWDEGAGVLESVPDMFPAIEDGVTQDAAGEPSIEAIVCRQDRPWRCDEALAVTWCESRHDPAAVDPTAENHGLWQLNEATWRPWFGEAMWSQVLDAEVNTTMAVEIYNRGGGWFPWSCRP